MPSAPGMSAAHGQDVVDRSMSCGTDTSQAQDTLRPCRTARAAASRTSSVTWFRVPRSSSSPQRPQFDNVSKYPSTSSCVGAARPAVIRAPTPPVPPSPSAITVGGPVSLRPGARPSQSDVDPDRKAA